MHIKYMKYYVYHIPGVKIGCTKDILEAKRGNYGNLLWPNS